MRPSWSLFYRRPQTFQAHVFSASPCAPVQWLRQCWGVCPERGAEAGRVAGARRARAEPREPQCPVETVVGEESVTETSDRRGAEAPGVAWHALHASTPCMRAARGARGTVMRREVQPRASTVACEGGRATTRGAAPRVCAGRRRARTPNCCVRGRPGDDAWCACLCSSPARESWCWGRSYRQPLHRQRQSV